MKLEIAGAWQLLRHISLLVFSWKKQGYFKRDKEKAVVRQIPVLLDEAQAPQMNCSPTQWPHGANPGRKGLADSSASSELLPKAKTTTKLLQGRGLRQRIYSCGVPCRDPTPAQNNPKLQQSFGATEANLAVLGSTLGTQEAVLGKAIKEAGKILSLLLLPGQHNSLGWFVLRGNGLVQEAAFNPWNHGMV